MDLDFSAEMQQIVEEITLLFSEETFSLNLLQKLQSDMKSAIERLDAASQLSQNIARKKAALKRMKTTISFKGNIQSEDFIAAFDTYFSDSNNKNRSRTIKSSKDIAQLQQDIQEKTDNSLLKSYLLDAYNLIMSVRDQFKQHIEYRLFVMGESGGKNIILMGSPSLDQMVDKSNVSSSLGVQLELTTLQLKTLINEYEQGMLDSSWDNLLDRSENIQQAWEILLKVREKIIKIKSNGKKVYYSFGQLIEALVYLQDKELTTDNIYNALEQGKNTVPFEVEGDFKLDGIDIQSKAFAVDGNDDDLHRIRLMNLAGIRRVLVKIYNATLISTDVNSLKSNLSRVFDKTTKDAVWNVAKADITKKIDEVLSELKVQ